LRAIAILSVVGFHAFPFWVQGGFIGVDIFFVISGFLISTIIVSSLERNSFNFVEFYIRRINRIFPAQLLVLIACFTFGWFVLLADEYKQLGKHIAGGAGFISNFLFWNESGYFDYLAETKPLLHLWSLGIEEQFYIAWPLMLWFAWKQRLNLLSITIVVVLISFALNINKVSSDAVAAFYSPQTRFWELMAGSVLAYMTLHKFNAFPKIWLDTWLGKIIYEHAPETHGKTLGNVQSIMGAVLITIGVLVITKEKSFPGWCAILPTLGAVLIISAGAQAWLNRVVLSNRILVWFGLISFPLYLWHWPLLSFARIIESETPSRNIRIAVVLISIVLAWLTYRLLEMPLRFGKYGTKITVVLAVLMGIVGIGGYDAYKNNRVSNGAAKVETLSRQFGWTIPVASTEQVRLCHDLFPERTQLSPKERDDNFCILAKNAPPNVLMVGDSLNFSLFPGISKDEKINALLLSASAAAPFYNIRTTEFNDSIRLLNYKLTN
jgi:peptidoglycan/LPS O-acetylase OafA/YrhL